MAAFGWHQRFNMFPRPGAGTRDWSDRPMRISADPHTVDDGLFDKLKAVYSEEEIVELVWAASFINGANKFNITMRLDTRDASVYPTNLEYQRLGAK